MGDKKYIIIGCPRSGTTFISKLFRNNGLDVGHESFGEDGISSWTIVGQDSSTPWGPSYQDVINKYNNLEYEIYHQVRHPIDTISSMLSLREISFKYIKQYIPIKDGDSKILQCMKFWYYWNLRTESLTQNRYKVSEAKEYFNLPIDYDNKKVNTREHKILTFEDLYNEDPQLTEEIKKLMTKYGF